MLLDRAFIVDGNNWGWVFTFEKAGDEFGTHVHTEKRTNHITMLLFGGVRLTGHEDYEGVEVYAEPGGTIIDWELGKPHGFTALVDGTTIANMLKVRA